MSTSIYLGMPPPNVENWIKENYVPPFDPSEPLCFTAWDGNQTIKIKYDDVYGVTYNVNDISLEYSTNKVDWINWASGSQILLVNPGDKVYIRANNDNNYYPRFDAYYFTISGNIQTLLSREGTRTDIPYSIGMFNEVSFLNLIMPMPATSFNNNSFQVFNWYNGSYNASNLKFPNLTLQEFLDSYAFYVDDRMIFNNLQFKDCKANVIKEFGHLQSYEII